MDNLRVFEAMHTIIENYRILAKEDREYLIKKLTEENAILPDDPYSFGDIQRDYEAGRLNKIPAIKAVRERSMRPGHPALGLKEAKDIVDAWSVRRY